MLPNPFAPIWSDVAAILASEQRRLSAEKAPGRRLEREGKDSDRAAMILTAATSSIGRGPRQISTPKAAELEASGNACRSE